MRTLGNRVDALVAEAVDDIVAAPADLFAIRTAGFVLTVIAGGYASAGRHEDASYLAWINATATEARLIEWRDLSADRGVR